MRPFTTLIDAATLASQIERDDLVLFDCRAELGNPHWGEARIRAFAPSRRAVPAPRSRSFESCDADSGRHPLPDPDAFALRLGQLGAQAASQLVAYDQGNGAYAARLWWLARWIGHRNVAVLDGGMTAWTAAGLPRGNLASRARAAPAQGKSHRRRMGGQRHGRRAAPATRNRAGRRARRGTVRRSQRNHRPGCRTHPRAPAMRLLPATWLATGDSCLRRHCGFAGTRCSAHSHRPAMIAMCGSGVTACHNLLAMEHAGLAGARLYAGSWSEWIRDPRRPIATGAY